MSIKWPEKKEITVDLDTLIERSYLGWNAAIDKFIELNKASRELELLDYDKHLRPLFDDVYNRKIINHSELKEKCSRFGSTVNKVNVDTIRKWWRFDNNQQPMSSYHDREDFIKLFMATSPPEDITVLLKEWINFADDVTANDYAGDDWLRGLRDRTREAIKYFGSTVKGRLRA